MMPCDQGTERCNITPVELIFDQWTVSARPEGDPPTANEEWRRLIDEGIIPDGLDLTPIWDRLTQTTGQPGTPAVHQWAIESSAHLVTIITAMTGGNTPARIRIGRYRRPTDSLPLVDIGPILFQDILDLLPATISIKDRHRRYQFVNRAWEIYAGVPRAEIIGRRHEEISLKPIDPDSIPNHLKEVSARDNTVLDTGCSLINQEESYRHADGTLRTLLSTKIPLLKDERNVHGILSITFDITDRKRMETELQAERQKAEAANQAKSQFLATISHEIRTPMNGLFGALMLIEQDGLSPEQHHMHRVARDSADALMGLLDDLLDFARLEAGKVTIEFIDFDLRGLIIGIIDLVKPRAVGNGLDITWSIDPTLPPIIRGDPARLRQILLNLIGNAIKFTARGHVAVRAQCGTTLPDGTFSLIIEVEDTGIGIPPEAFPRLFQRFSQVDSSTTRRFGGSGLGLAICRQLCELMGGSISVASNVGHGSTFRFIVPVTAGDPTVATESMTPALATNPIPALPERSLRVLVVEDNIVNRDIVRILLTRAGHEVAVAGNGVEAVAMVRTQPYDVVLMDIEMPEMDGITAVRLIRAMPEPACRVPIIALTAHASAHHRQEYLAAGMTDYVTKPIHPKKLWATLQHVAAGPARDRGSPRNAAAPVTEPLLDMDQAVAIAEELGPDRWQRMVIAFSRSANQLLATLAATGDGPGHHQIVAQSLRAIALNLGARRLGAIAGQLQHCDRITAADIVVVLEPLAETIAALGSVPLSTP